MNGKRPTEKMVGFLASLVDKRNVPAACLAILSAAEQGTANIQQVSHAIDTCKSAPWKNTLEAALPAETGYYLYEGTPYVVTKGKESGKSYAKMLTSTGWAYASGMVYKLKPEHRMTLEQARAYGKLHGRCAICGKTLSDPKSCDLGIGPVCIKKVA